MDFNLFQGLGNKITDIHVFPNPADHGATISFDMKRQQHVLISVTDVNSQVVLPVIEKDYNACEQKVKLNTNKLRNGIYFIRLSSESMVENRILVVIL